ncbi:MAG: pseudouridine synthase [Alkalibacterium gilvum]|uniref:Pseudouridine synthase n=1 Tax=Alkalibacterium gilvum TaxID=1130080 RepID=A0A1H6R182_9LACT|nr:MULTISPECIES: pseudouridine synthase [Alkalibacterium]MDN6295377.1 rRNA pseudouridine synthase [Alkalibacterium sp.]SEI48146.1 23S rRNA pseudouridine2605 synthase [Alkalibacterium gilvum]HAJ70062.1 rRNA pseudouridine synthase [Alkalibacterium sp.]
MERLQKVMAHAGIASRRGSEKLIKEGRVQVNGKVVTEMGVNVSNKDSIKVNDIPITKEQTLYFVLNKPRGVISSVGDPKGRKTVVDFFNHIDQRVYPVGRLDYDTTGVLLLTNDGELTNQLTHPKYGIEKTYIAKVTGSIDKQAIKRLEDGLDIDDYKTLPAKARIMDVDKRKNKSMVELTIHEGKNHQVKKMLKTVGFPVEKLNRTQYGFLTTEGLQSGEWRELKSFEVNKLRQLVKDNA